MKTLYYKYPFASAMDKVKERILNCRLLLIFPGIEKYKAIRADIDIECLRTVKDMKVAGQLDETIGADWFI